MTEEITAVDDLQAGIRETKGKVFLLIGSYLPGFKGGGPTRSTSNLVSALGKEFAFKVVTLDRDHRATSPYPDIPANQWVKTGNADVMYLRPGWGGLVKMIQLLRSVEQSSLLYLNSFFSRRFSMLPVFLKRLGLIHPGCLVLAPRGEFSPGALQIKSRRKKLHIMLSRWLGLYRGTIWHASSQLEAADIQRWFGGTGVISIAAVIPKPIESNRSLTQSPLHHTQSLASLPHANGSAQRLKTSGHLRIVFVSRISPKKNLLNALRMLKGIIGDVFFDIYGPLEDVEYWSACERVIGTLPPNIRVRYCGEVEHDRVLDLFAMYDLFLFPTLGENYGHVICEALAAGCPVLISDRTPWRGLSDAGAGWDIPLDDVQEFRRALQSCIDADHEMYEELRVGAREYVRKYVANPEIISANRRLFQEAAAIARAPAR
jgi:glycosyltransferase involved in cell wall biosynthesis